MLVLNNRIMFALCCAVSLGVWFGRPGLCGEEACILQGVREDGKWRLPEFSAGVTSLFLCLDSGHYSLGGGPGTYNVRLIACPEAALIFHFGSDSELRVFSQDRLEEKARVGEDEFLKSISLPERVHRKGGMRFCQASVGLSDDGGEELVVLWSFEPAHGAFVSRIAPRGVAVSAPGAVQTLNLRIVPRSFSRLVWSGRKGVYALILSKEHDAPAIKEQRVTAKGKSVCYELFPKSSGQLKVVSFSSRTGEILAENGIRIPASRWTGCMAFAPLVQRGAMVLERNPITVSDQKDVEAVDDEVRNFTLDGTIEEEAVHIPARSAEAAVYAGDGRALYLFASFSFGILDCAEGKLLKTPAKISRIKHLLARFGQTSVLSPRQSDEMHAEMMRDRLGWVLSPSGESVAIRAMDAISPSLDGRPVDDPVDAEGQRRDRVGVQMLAVRSQSIVWARTNGGMGFADADSPTCPDVCWAADSKGLVVGTRNRVVLLDGQTGDTLAAVVLNAVTDRFGRPVRGEARGPKKTTEERSKRESEPGVERAPKALDELLWGVPMEVTLETVGGQMQITCLAKGSALDSLGLKEGDVIETLNDKVLRLDDAKCLDDMFDDAMERMSRGEPSILKVRRGDSVVEILIR